jgi:hypothetical protein
MEPCLGSIGHQVQRVALPRHSPGPIDTGRLAVDEPISIMPLGVRKGCCSGSWWNSERTRPWDGVGQMQCCRECPAIRIAGPTGTLDAGGKICLGPDHGVVGAAASGGDRLHFLVRNGR